MKKNIYIALTVAMMGFTACSEDTFDHINKDTYHPAPEVVPAYLQLSEAIMNTGFSTVSGDLSFYLSSLNEQNIGVGNNQLMKAELRNSIEWANSSTFNNVWSGTYSNLLNIQQMIDKIENGTTGNEGQYDILGIAQILKVMDYGILTDMFGDIPYSEALKGQECLQPKLDSQKDIYADLLVTLDKAIGNLETAVNDKLKNVRDQDLVFGGDMNKWLASAYGLKARYLIHQTAVDKSVLASAEAAAQKAIELGFAGMTIKEFNGVTCDNPWSAFIWSRSYIASSAKVAKMMEATGDPRLSAYTAGGEATLVEPGDADASKVMDGSLGYPAWYDLGSQPIHLLSQAEVYFILAEAQLRQGKDATEAFQAAVTSALTDILTIMDEDASGAADFAASLGKPTLKLLFEQKYLAQCVDEQVETYNDIRRCEAMGEHHIAMTNPYNTQGGMSRVPKRLPYGNDSVLNNPTIAEAYGDGFYVYDQPVWWAGGTR
ncbi:MAG: SusD/RagB family nutrient-binding outer membrane lipoprotein [Parabacteroides sp.]|nr:SusD/RagB family nutrient-binding outer membrane lipoprotein [Parabacteroides sp.]